MTEKAVTQSERKIMKTFLLLIISSVIAAGVLPSLPAKIVLSALVLTAALTQAARSAPVGYQDEKGFHLVRARRRVTKGRALVRVGRKILVGWLFPDARRPVRA
jgi:hypothetical protein